MARLRRVDCSDAGITRRRRGKGFEYLDQNDNRIEDTAVLARINRGTDLQKLIEETGVGKVYSGNSADDLKRFAEELADNDSLRHSMGVRCRELAAAMFSPSAAANQILALHASPKTASLR